MIASAADFFNVPRYDHESMLDGATVKALFDSQGLSLIDFGFRKCFGRDAYSPAPSVHGLRELSAAHVDAVESEWLFKLLADNRTTLRRLRLGIEHELVVDYAKYGRLQTLADIRQEDSRIMLVRLEDTFAYLTPNQGFEFALDEFFCGIDLHVLRNPAYLPIFNLTRLLFLNLNHVTV